MCAKSSARDRNQKLRCFLRRQRSRAQSIGQRPALHIFHGEERRAFVFPDVVNVDDVRVVQRRRRFRFREKAFQFRRPVIAGQHLERDEPVQLSLPRSKDDAHPAASQFPLDLVAADDPRAPPPVTGIVGSEEVESGLAKRTKFDHFRAPAQASVREGLSKARACGS